MLQSKLGENSGSDQKIAVINFLARAVTFFIKKLDTYEEILLQKKYAT